MHSINAINCFVFLLSLPFQLMCACFDSSKRSLSFSLCSKIIKIEYSFSKQRASSQFVRSYISRSNKTELEAINCCGYCDYRYFYG